MIVVRTELWSAITHQKNHIGTAVIVNDGTGSHDIGNYDVYIGKPNEEDPLHIVRTPSACWKQTRVELFPRTFYGAWELVAQALEEIA